MEIKHSEDRRCEILFKGKERTESKGVIEIFLCKTHKIIICKCGFEWGKHNYLEIKYPHMLLYNIFKKK